MESHSHSNTTSSSYKEEKEKLVNNIILMNKQLGKGGFGKIYMGRNLKENVPTAIKIEESGNRSHLKEEYKSLKALQGLEGIPRVFKFLKSEKQNYLIMELLGKSIETLFNKRKKHFTNKTILQIAYQMIERIESIHSKGYIHRDIKPGNFVIGRGEDNKKIYIIDFGLARRYRDKDTNKHIPYKEGKGLTGTPRYVSLFTHYGIEQSRRDDIESIAYNLIYFAKGKLPWQDVKTKNKKEKHRKIMEIKIAYTPEKLCEGISYIFSDLLKYARELKFKEEPDYESIKLSFKNTIIKSGGAMDWKFDWNINKIKEKKKQLKEELN